MSAEITEVTLPPQRDDIERLDPVSTPLRLQSGTEIAIEPLKLRQFLKMLRIVTMGGARIMGSMDLNMEDDAAFVQQLMALVFFAVPEAEDETVEFIQAMVAPVTMTGDAKQDMEARLSLLQELENPELEDTLTIIEAIVQREGADLRALGNRLRAMWTVARKMGEVPQVTKRTRRSSAVSEKS